jgi:hypothetical protein
MQATRGRGSTAPTHSLPQHLNGGEWWVARPGHSLPAGKVPQYPLYRRLGGPQSWSGHRLEEKTFASARDRTPVSRLSSLWLDTIMTELLQLHNCSCTNFNYHYNVSELKLYTAFVFKMIVLRSDSCKIWQGIPFLILFRYYPCILSLCMCLPNSLFS